MGLTGGLFVVIIIAYFLLRKVLEKSDVKNIRKLQAGTKEKTFSADVIYQRLYIYLVKFPYLKRYVNKLRRRLEILNIEDEYLTRKQR